MKKCCLFICLLLSSYLLFAQNDDPEKMHQNAKTFMQQGDFANASLILTRALSLAPDNIEIAKDLAYDYYLQKQNQNALDVLKPFLDKDKADDQTYQIAGTVYQAMDKNKDAENIYKKGIKQFPQSGPLYNEYGELLWNQQDYSAIKQWEKGIQEDPDYGNNYYNACKYYYLTTDKVWSLIYGEIFINIESFTARTAEIKNILLDGYKKLFATTDLLANAKDKNNFEVAFLTTMNKENSVVKNGLNAETLTMIRTRFVLDWNKNYSTKFPLSIFSKQEQLLQDGLFPAYNQWIFGASQNLSAYQSWINTHADEYAAFNKFQQGRLFKMKDGEYYH